MADTDEGLGEYIRERFRELQQSFDNFAQRIEDRTGDHAVRIAKLEWRADQTDQRFIQTTEGRRWSVGTWIAVLSALAAIAAVVVAVVALSAGK